MEWKKINKHLRQCTEGNEGQETSKVGLNTRVN